MTRVRVWSYDAAAYVEHTAIGKVRYVGRTFGPAGLTDGAIYYVLAVEGGMLRVVDDEEMGYLYDMFDPGPFDASCPTGKWELIDDYTGLLTGALGR